MMASGLHIDASPTVMERNIALIHMPIQERIDWVIQRAVRQSAEFQDCESWLERNRYLAQHPTAIAALMCMDGRVNVSLHTKMPRGIIQPFRNLGGRFDLGWPNLGELLAESVVDETKKGRMVLCLVTYHFSKSDRHRGCAGFGYDTEEARAHAFNVVRQLDRCFGGKHRSVFPLAVGIETDEEALIFHGADGKLLDLSTVSPNDHHYLLRSVTQLYPDMPEQMVADLLPLLHGNISHIADLKQIDHSFNLDHHEWIICLGRGFDWLQMANLALIIGPYSPDLSEPIHTAATIIEANMRNKRIPDDGFLILAEASYDHLGVGRARAGLESRFLAEFAARVIRERHPDLAKTMHLRSAIISKESRGIEFIVQ